MTCRWGLSRKSLEVLCTTVTAPLLGQGGGRTPGLHDKGGASRGQSDAGAASGGGAEAKTGGDHGETGGGMSYPWRGTRPVFARRASAEGPTPVEAPSPSLPKGGGAIRSIAEKFGVASATGAGSMSVPLPLSPGRSGFGPQLSLGYSSGAGNGLFGLGWSVGLPAVTRKADKGLPEYRDEADSDTFILAGFEDLVPLLVQGQNGPTRDVETVGTERRERFRPRVETPGGSARIERITVISGGSGVGDVFWRSTTKDNVVSEFGRTAAARIADPADERRVFSWLLEESRDDRGNVVRYEYKAETLDGAPNKLHERHHHGGFAVTTANRHPKRILWGNSGELSSPPVPSDFHLEAVFDYGEHDADAPTPNDSGTWLARQDAFSSYRAGFELRTYRLCRRVLVFHRGFTELDAQGAPVLVRSLDLSYDETPSVTYLTSATQQGYIQDGEGGYDSEALPPVSFEHAADVCDAEGPENARPRWRLAALGRCALRHEGSRVPVDRSRRRGCRP